MQKGIRFRIDPELKQIVVEASRALACLDSDRLEEMAACCHALNRDLPPQAEVARQAREAEADMATFARVLEATRANLNVMRRLRDLRRGMADYPGALWPIDGGRNGNH